MKQRGFTRIVLPNGLRLVLVPRPSSLTSTVFVSVEAGSKYETRAENGISHFLEHMCFKGTTRRPTAMAIASELDGLGAQYNAFTSQEFTSYYAKVKNEFLPQTLDVVSDIYLNPVFDSREIEKEKGVIVEEINMYEDMPARRVHDLFMELVYGDQPAGWNIAGTKAVVRRLTRDDFVRYRSRHYVPRATVVAVAGGFNRDTVARAVRERFGRLPIGPKDGKRRVVEQQKGPRQLVYHKTSDQAHLVLGFRAFALADPRRYALQVLSDVLGGSMSSRLFHVVREEMGAAYYVRTADDLYSDHGLFTISAGVDVRRIDEVITAILRECTRLKTALISPAELKKAKDHIIGTLFLSLETSDELGGFYGAQEVLKLPLVSPETVARRIAAVTAEEIRVLARALFRPAKLNLAVIGPFRAKSFQRILQV